ncbi:fimbria/pilus outer membrane usher protein [Winslowiella sp. 2C04]|uniref:fimbria/pilus outer membrane usher protein n=1 Tax=Winslowiella sp. 2C04 TaxID=3416179 RepID=UPI003CE87FBD
MFLGKDVASLDNLSYLGQGNALPPGDYILYLYIDDDFIKNVRITFKKSSDTNKVEACFTKDIIESIPLNASAKKKFDFASDQTDKCIDVKKYINDFDYEVDVSKLILKLSIPQIYLDSVRSTLASEDDWDDGIPFFLMNYNMNGSSSTNKGYGDYSSFYTNLNNRANFGPWRFNSNVYLSESKSGGKVNHELTTNNIYLTRNINAIKSNLVIGQNTLGSNLFDSNQYVGVTLGTSDEMLPDSERGYSPAIRGIADSRSKLTIRQNNNIIYQTYVNPGPFDINNLNSVGTSGDYEVELTSSDGVVKKYTVPYSSLPNLLRSGNFNYSATLGQLDSSATKNNNFFQSTVAVGIPLEATVFLGTQISNKYMSTGLGIGKDFGYLGAVSIDALHAKSEIDNNKLSGQSYRILYSKSFPDMGTNIQLTGYRYSTSDYYSLSEASNKSSLQNNGIYSNYNGKRKDSFQLNLSQNINDFGQLYVWGSIISYWGTETKSKNMQFGWNKSFRNNVTVSASYNKNTFSGTTDDAFYLSLSMPLTNGTNSSPMYLSNSTSYNDSGYNNITSVYGNVLDNKLDYNVYQSVNKDSDNNTTNVNANYRASSINLHAGTSYTAKTKEFDYGASGGILFHKDGVVFTREANDTAILIEALGAAGARINRSGENIVINNSGYALIPYATPYHYNDVELDPTTFGNGYDIDNKVLKISPTRGAISKVIFDVRKGYNFLVAVKYKDKPIRFGSLVNNNADNSVSIANDDGTVYLTGVKNNSNYTVNWDYNTSCQFSINYDDNLKLDVVNKINVNCS